MEEVTKPLLNKNNNNTPYNIDYEDFYHSKSDGLAEAHYVFQQGNDLPFRWKNKQIFTIAEAGFGTGLNFLTTWQTWEKTSERYHQLHYISIEKHPLSVQALSELLAAWPELSRYTTELLPYYPPALSGMHRINLSRGAVRLTLCFMDVATALDELCATVDCWYLDGFAPAKNPDMWSPEIMAKMAQLSSPDTTLSAYTAASQVRRNLQAAGWTVKKRPGFGKKREMLTASLHAEPEQHISLAANPPIPQIPPLKRSPNNIGRSYQAWYTPPPTTTSASALASPNRNKTSRSATIIGGGIAGCQIAYALAQRGWRIHLVERHSKLAQEASGNPAGIISPKMTAQPGWGERFYRQAFLYTLQQLAQLAKDGNPVEWNACGSLQLNHNAREQQRWLALQERGLPAEFIQFPDTAQASTVAGIDLDMGGSFFPQAGWIQPQSFCRALIQHPNITVTLETAALSLDYRHGQHYINTATGQSLAVSDTLIISNGRDVHTLLPSLSESYLPLNAVKGQTSTALAGKNSRQLKVALGHEGYLTPAINGQHIFGATFDRDIDNNIDGPSTAPAADISNYQQLQQHLPAFSAGLHDVHSGHAAIRMTTPDRYPYCGPLPNVNFYRESYADLYHGRKYRTYPAAHYQPGLFIATGFGSRGLTTSALSAELLACLINGEPLPLEKSLYYQLHPARFLVKQLKTNRVTLS